MKKLGEQNAVLGQQYQEPDIAPDAPVYSDHPLYRGRQPEGPVTEYDAHENVQIPKEPEPLPTFNPTMVNQHAGEQTMVKT